MKRVYFAMLLLLLSFSVHAGNAAEGKTKAMQGKEGERCSDCHGAEGNKPNGADRPILAGQHYDYLVRSLKEYKSGKRNNAQMSGPAQRLSQKDIEDLAAWFASQKSSLKDQR